MKPEYSKLREEHRSEHEQQVTNHTQAAQKAQEFASVEELLRHDNEQNPVPAAVGDRLNNSLAAEPKPAKPWYKQLFGS